MLITAKNEYFYHSGASEASGAAILVIYPVRLARGSSPFAVSVCDIGFKIDADP